MITDLLAHWPVDMERSFLIGDRQSDIEAARNAGISGFLFEGGSLDEFAERLLDCTAADAPSDGFASNARQSTSSG